MESKEKEAMGAEMVNVVSDTDGGENEVKEEEVVKRGKWAGTAEFTFTCISMAIGLGNLWRFPYLVYRNGGGAFLIPYVIMQVFIGIPLYFMEVSFGQFASLGPITIWKVSPLMKGIGYCMVITILYVSLYYNVLISYCFFYLFSSMTSVLPFSLCNNEWNTQYCSTTGQAPVNVSSTDYWMNRDIRTKTPTEEYFENYVLRQSNGIEEPGVMQWKLVLSLLLAWVLVFLVISKGVKSLGKVVYFTATCPYILLLALLIRGATLPGAEEGVIYYIYPTWDRLKDPRVWSDAATQVFFSLGLCNGGLIAMSSFNKFRNNSLREALLIPFIDFMTSILSGFVIFTVLGFIAKQKNVDIAEVANAGPGLAFVIYPEAIAHMPGSVFWSIVFFLMMIVVGLSTQFSMVEVILSSFSDEWESIIRKNWKTSLAFRISVCAICFLLGLPMTTQGGFYILLLMDISINSFSVLIAGIFEIVAINYLYGYENFASDISMMLGRKPSIFWKACWCVITPLMLAIMIIGLAIQHNHIYFYTAYSYPKWAQTLGFLIMISPVLAVPTVFLIEFCRRGGYPVLKKNIPPLPEWGPCSPENRTGCYARPNEAVTCMEQEPPNNECRDGIYPELTTNTNF